ncbi:hypothetical protein BKA64DRAFT_123228 [Cadophora sp. MPI-SDFR-AT-0126]|nr:hypothetical protein BKA64DRAFT_123228 [Leotiomycetes sp. MPI-SDFR-AT-0126]
MHCSHSQCSNPFQKGAITSRPHLTLSVLSLFWNLCTISVFPVFLHKCDGPRYWPLGSPSMPNPYQPWSVLWICQGIVIPDQPGSARGPCRFPGELIHAALGLESMQSESACREPWAWFMDGGLIGEQEEVEEEEDQARLGEDRGKVGNKILRMKDVMNQKRASS